MSDTSITVMAVAGSVRQASITRVVLEHVSAALKADGCMVDFLDLRREPLPLYNPDTAHGQPGFPGLRARVERADVYLLGSPDYHGGIGGALKNFLDHFWREFTGKLFVTLVASHEKGLTATDQLRTVARQCYAWTLPYGVSFMEKGEVRDGRIVSSSLDERLGMLARDARVYGRLLAEQRHADLAGDELGFLAVRRS